MQKRLKLKAFRALNGLSQEEAARRIGCSRSRYSGIEAGRRDGTPEFWRALQAAFEVPDADMWALMQRENTENSEN